MPAIAKPQRFLGYSREMDYFCNILPHIPTNEEATGRENASQSCA